MKKYFKINFQMLIDWINSELAETRVIIKDLEEDLYDGHILQLLIGNFLDKLKFKKRRILKEILY